MSSFLKKYLEITHGSLLIASERAIVVVASEDYIHNLILNID